MSTVGHWPRRPPASGSLCPALSAGAPGRAGPGRAAGLQHCPAEALLHDVLTWEREQGLDRPRSAGLSARREHELLTALAYVG